MVLSRITKKSLLKNSGCQHKRVSTIGRTCQEENVCRRPDWLNTDGFSSMCSVKASLTPKLQEARAFPGRVGSAGVYQGPDQFLQFM